MNCDFFSKKRIILCCFFVAMLISLDVRAGAIDSKINELRTSLIDVENNATEQQKYMLRHLVAAINNLLVSLESSSGNVTKIVDQQQQKAVSDMLTVLNNVKELESKGSTDFTSAQMRLDATISALPTVDKTPVVFWYTPLSIPPKSVMNDVEVKIIGRQFDRPDVIAVLRVGTCEPITKPAIGLFQISFVVPRNCFPNAPVISATTLDNGSINKVTVDADMSLTDPCSRKTFFRKCVSKVLHHTLRFTVLPEAIGTIEFSTRKEVNYVLRGDPVVTALRACSPSSSNSISGTAHGVAKMPADKAAEGWIFDVAAIINTNGSPSKTEHTTWDSDYSCVPGHSQSGYSGETKCEGAVDSDDLTQDTVYYHVTASPSRPPFASSCTYNFAFPIIKKVTRTEYSIPPFKKVLGWMADEPLVIPSGEEFGILRAKLFDKEDSLIAGDTCCGSSLFFRIDYRPGARQAIIHPIRPWDSGQ